VNITAEPSIPLQPADGFDVLDICHRETVVALGQLSVLIARLSQQGTDSESQALAGAVIRHFTTEARRHHQDEELHVFPRLLNSSNTELARQISSLKQDHDWLELDWSALQPHLDAIACGQPCVDCDALRGRVKMFTDLSLAHIALEEACVYPKARAQLGYAEHFAMAREMAQRRYA
jgi:iron-sulfur cluster repair protein YtfE (RIC family)